jgi:hypothetical protein
LQTENRKRTIAARKKRVKLKNAPKPLKPRKCLTDTIMAPSKLAEPCHIARSARAQTRSQGPLEERKHHPLEIVDIDEISSLEEIPVRSTPILEEAPKPQIEAMKQYTPVAAHEPQHKEEETH